MNQTTPTALASAPAIRQAENRLAMAAPSTSPAALDRIAARVALEETLAAGIKHGTDVEVSVCFSGEDMVTVFGRKEAVDAAVAWLVAAGWVHTESATDDEDGEVFAYLDTSRAH